MNKLIFLALFLTSIPLYTQTKIKIRGNIDYVNKDYENPIPDFRLMYNRYYIYYESSQHDGTVKVESHSGKVVNGTYVVTHIIPNSGIKSPPGLSAFFPALRSVKKIEFFDRNGDKFFEDTFEQVPMYVPTITKTSGNSFTVSNIGGGMFVSIDRAKTWELVKSIDFRTNSFSVSESITSNPDTVIVICSKDPNPPYARGVSLWANNPNDYVFEFADDEEPAPQIAPSVASSNNNTQKSFLSRIFGK